jgi:hypothetical protein
MKRIATAAALAMLLSAPVVGQTPGEKPASVPAAKVKAEKAAVKQKEIKLASGKGTSRLAKLREDARKCLEFATNHEIIKCAEDYR